MATEYVIQGPTVQDITKKDTVPAYALGTEVTTATLGLNKPRIYKYVRARAAFTAGVPVFISSVNELLYAASVGEAVGQGIAVPQVAITSPSGSQYGFEQVGGYFDNSGAAAGVGILTNSAVAERELFLTGTAGSCSTVPTLSTNFVSSIGARALTTGSSSNVYAFSPAPLVAVKDQTA